jgi:hypothetical protein
MVDSRCQPGFRVPFYPSAENDFSLRKPAKTRSPQVTMLDKPLATASKWTPRTHAVQEP